MRRHVFDPTMPLETTTFSYSSRPASLQGLRVGLVENTKVNSAEILRRMADRLERRFHTTLVHLDRKRSSGHSVSNEAIALFQQKADLVIAGVGD
jgi:hypothetical protein